MIRAIETRYAGHLFRSRLEARWAHAFDLMGIRWEYEAQGYEVGNRLSWNWGGEPAISDCWSGAGCSGCLNRTWPYLPDFWLPDLKIWAEVKGSIESEEALTRILDTVASMGDNGCGPCGEGDTLILGPITYPFRAPWRLHMHEGSLTADAWEGQSSGLVELAGDNGDRPDDWRAAASLLLAGAEPATNNLRSAMMCAAQARFEHGETPEPPRR